MRTKTSLAKKPIPEPKHESGTARVTLSVNHKLLKAVDQYAHLGNTSRSAVFEAALLLWYEKIQEESDREFYSQEAGDPEIAGWSKVTSEAARYLWNE